MKSPFTLKSTLTISMKKIFILFSLIYAMNSYASNKHFISTDAFTNPCDASFTFTESNGFLTMNFFPSEVDSLNFIASWDFGDGGTSSQWNASYQFPHSGPFNVCLKIQSTIDTSCHDYYCTTVTVKKTIECSANFSVTPDENQDKLIYFSNNSSDNSIATWDFGDGNTSNLWNPSHQFSHSGSFNVCLKIQSTIDISCHDDYCATVIVKDPPTCSPDFSATWYTSDYKLIKFINKSTPYNVTYFWDFGDGETATDKEPQHLYKTEGDYVVSLTIKSPFCTNTHRDTIKARFIDCNCNFKIQKDSLDWRTFHLQNFSKGVNYKWDFGDGTISTSANPGSHTYAKPGFYTITLTSYCETGQVNGVFCGRAVIVSLDDNCKALFTIQRDNTTTDPYDFIVDNQSTGANLNYHWNFGDGNTSDIKNPDHQYEATGPYTICLSVKNESCYSIYCDTLSIKDTLSHTTDSLHRFTPNKFSIRVIDKTTSVSELTSGKATLLNYPNPFNNSTTITYELKARSEVSLSVFNILGNKLQVLENTTKQAGSYSVEWSPQDFSEGLYILQLKVNDQLITKKVIKN
jgi:PKD repeat protein